MANENLEQAIQEQTPKCVYKRCFENSGTTFKNPNEELKKCINCTGYDPECKIYRSMIELYNKIRCRK